MASFVWHGGAGDGDFDNGANYEGGSAPSGVGSHDLLIKGNMDMTSNCNKPLMAIGTLSFAEYRGRVTDPLIFLSITTVNAGLAGGGQAVVGSAGTIGTTVITGDASSLFVMYSGTWTTAEAAGVQLTAMSSAIPVTLRIYSVGTFTFASGSAMTTFELDGISRGSTLRSIATVRLQLGSYLLLQGSAAVTTKAWVFGGATLEQIGSGTITDIDVKPGCAFIAEHAQKPFTITNSSTAGNARFDTMAKGVTITFTNPLVKRYERMSSLYAAGGSGGVAP